MEKLAAVFWNESEQRVRALVRIFFFIGIWRALSLLLDLLLIGPMAWVVRRMTDAPLLWLERSLHFVLYLVAVFLALLIASRWPDRRPLRDYAMEPTARQWGDLLAGTLLGLALMAVIFLGLWSMGWVRIEEFFFVNIPDLPFALAILGPLLAFVVIAIAEEVVFRGHILRNAAEGLHGGGGRGLDADRALIAAWLISSVLFGLFHVFNPNATWASTINLILAGLMLGLPVVLTGRLGFAVGLHFAWNFAQGTLFGFPVSGNEFEGTALMRTTLNGPTLWTGGEFGPEAGLLGLLMLVVGSLLIIVWAARREGALRIAGALSIYRQTPPIADPAHEAGRSS